jgi:hypothetical protein
MKCELDVKVELTNRLTKPYLAQLISDPSLVVLITDKGYVYLNGSRPGQLYTWEQDYANTEDRYTPLTAGSTVTLTQA